MMKRSHSFVVTLLFLSMMSAISCADSSDQTASTDSKLTQLSTGWKVRLVHVDSEPNKRKILFENASPFVHALDMAPQAREEKLNQGTWLVMACGIWSATDIKCIEAAVRGAASYDGKVQLGVRPFSKYEEMLNWYPEYGEETRSPLWVMFRDGKTLGHTFGQLSAENLTEFIKKTLQQ
jgi:hypothetical protein